jgi:hypothetical protein
MELIVVAVLIQTLYYLAYDQHIFIVLFIGLSLLGQQYTQYKYYYLGIPIILTHAIYLLYSRFYKRDLEQFKGFNKAKKRAKKGTNKTTKGTKKGINKTAKGTKRVARKAHKGMKKAQKAIEKAVKENARVVGTIQSGITKAYKQAMKAAQDDGGGKVKETPNLDTSKAEKANYDPKKDAPKV